MEIPLVDLKKQYVSIRKEMDSAIKRVIASGEFILGEETEKFEKEFSNFCGAKYAVGVDSGISALELGMLTIGIGKGDEVLVPDNSFIASASAVSFTGARPVLVDCLKADFNVDLEKAEGLITKKTKAIMPVHLYGRMVDMDKVLKLARKYKLKIVEDACQAHGASLQSKMAGSFGDFAAFSFYPAKNLGAYGDGGMVVTNNRQIYETVKMMRNYGQKEKYNHVFLAWNRRLDNLQAAILRIKLRRLKRWNAQRQKFARLYKKYLEKIPVDTPDIPEDRSHVFHLYVIRVKKREQLIEYLRDKGIQTGVHYPIPIHLQKAYENLGYGRGDFPVTERLAKEILSLPMHPHLTKQDVRYISKSIGNFFGRNG